MNKLLQELKESKTADEFAGLSSIISLSIQENPARWIDELEEDVRAGRPVGRPWAKVRDRLQSR